MSSKGRPLSQHPSIRPVTAICGSVATALGINALFNPRLALSFFNMQSYYPVAASDPVWRIIDAQLMLYAARDIYVGIAVVMAAWVGNRKAMGGLMLGSAVVAGFDGLAVKMAGAGGEWGHWGFIPVALGLGVVSLGMLD